MEQTVKPYRASLTVHLNHAAAFLGVLLIALPEMITQVVATLADPTIQQSIAAMPERVREIVDLIVRGSGGVLTLFALLNNLVRVYRTKSAVAAPFSKGSGGSGSSTLVALLVATVLLAGCGSSAFADFTYPKLETIATPDAADEVLWLGTLAYQFTVGSINALHDAGVFPQSEWEALVANEGSPAEKVRDALTRGFDASEAWRESGNRTPFDTLYKDLSAQYTTLRDAWRKWRGSR